MYEVLGMLVDFVEVAEQYVQNLVDEYKESVQQAKRKEPLLIILGHAKREPAPPKIDDDGFIKFEELESIVDKIRMFAVRQMYFEVIQQQLDGLKKTVFCNAKEIFHDEVTDLDLMNEVDLSFDIQFTE
jgi:hypothetical protein